MWRGTFASMRQATLTTCPERWPTLPQSVASLPRVQPVDWGPPSILRLPEVLTEGELADAEAELKALQRHGLGIIEPESR